MIFVVRGGWREDGNKRRDCKEDIWEEWGGEKIPHFQEKRRLSNSKNEKSIDWPVWLTALPLAAAWTLPLLFWLFIFKLSAWSAQII